MTENGTANGNSGAGGAPALPPGLNAGVREILLAGIGVFAALAIVIGYGIDPQSALPNAAIVVAVGFIALLISWIANEIVVRKVLTWFAGLLMVLWVVVLIASKIYPDTPSIACLASPWESCASINDGIAERLNKRPPVVAQEIPKPPAVNPASYRVFMQFAGTLRREDVRTVMEDLERAGWGMQGTSGGGERTTAAANFRQVRYGDDADKGAAEALATAVTQSGLINQPVAAKKVAGIPSKQLEIFISN